MIKYTKASIIRLFTITHTRGWYGSFAKLLGNTYEIVLFFCKILALQPANAIKTKFIANICQGFCLLILKS